MSEARSREERDKAFIERSCARARELFGLRQGLHARAAGDVDGGGALSRPEPSPLEVHVGVRALDMTAEERAAVDRIKVAARLLSFQQKHGSPSDIVMDLGPAIAAELRRVEEATQKAVWDQNDSFVEMR